MATAFELLTPRVRDALAAEGLAEPTQAQEAAIPRILAGEDVLLIAPTGAGKTEAAMLPVLAQLAQRPRGQGIGCVYVTPLRALNRDMHRRLEQWCAKLDLRVEVRHGDTPQSQRRKQALKPPDLLVTTPETLQAILPAKVMRRHLRTVQWVVVDEVHQLAKDRRGVQLTVALERLREVAGDFQRIALSATVGDPARVAALFGGPQPLAVVRAAPPKQMSFRVEWPKPTDEDFALARELFISPEIASVMSLMRDTIEAHRASLVFVNSRGNAELLGSRFPLVMEGVAVHHGSLSRESRERAEADFKAGRLKALVCTSTLELGIDVGAVDQAIQYQSPRQATSLVQRVGRAGHDLKRVSKGIIIPVNADDTLESIAVIGRAQRGELEPPHIHEGALDVLGHQIVGIVMDAGGRVPRAQALAVVQRAWPYRDAAAGFDKMAAYMEHLQFLRRDGDLLVMTGRARDYYFRNLSTIRDERTYPIVDLATMQAVGIMGEEEMVLRARPGYVFIVRGRTWRIQTVGHDGSVYVHPHDDPTARIAAWDGQILPVPFETAQASAGLRGDVGARLDAGAAERVIQDLGKVWPADLPTVRRVVELIEAHKATGAPVPDERTVLVEAFDRYVIVHAPFGEVVNETIADIGEELLARKNLVRFWWTDGNRILYELLTGTQDLDLDALARELLVHSETEVEELLQVFQKDHLPIGWYIKGVAERVGALPRGLMISADDLQSLEVRFKGTPVAEEALREAMLEDVDPEHVRWVYKGLREGSLKLVTRKAAKPTPLGYPIVRRNVEVPEVLSPEQDREQAVERMRQFLQTEQNTLLCFGCGHLAHGKVVGELPERPACDRCASPVVGVLSWHGTPIQEAFKRHMAGEELAEQDAKEMARCRQGADLVAVYGRKAVMALSVYGVGPQAAAKILAKMHRDDRAFFRDLYEAKLRYVLTRPFWDRPGSGGWQREPVGKPSAYSAREGPSTERRI
ncbi:MAG TPA: DEAD/DEAH box helicase [Candidatus Thermoplasmatota archaeon]|jgi:ATP-dependent Lhr-like helicase|nr:DEAD/DEAH box helicase [Candidatus Thermoplasmatota archaeon]